ncbi:hypothetical protein [uncultured Clostridium sp.]|uniref:DUF7922 domain-containing protein n=1 Tax=uncultured Clostridium sp. TaxID=59620 RepID=UPI0028F0A6F1|nr:hypothetical protein [uncultured Clostridium sp.]
MAHNKLYRNFIILQEDERGYSHANEKALSGYAKIEAKGDKCKISFYAQNLRQEDNYSMVLICNKRDARQLIDIGPLAINEVGKGDTSKEYYVNNIADLGISYEKVSGAAICRVKDNENEFIMHGFMNGEDSADNWRKFKYIKADSKKYISKSDEEYVKKDTFNPDIANKTIVSQVSDTFIKTPELQNELAERKKYENDIFSKGNIELGKSNNNSSIQETENRVPEGYTNIYETKDDFSEDRKKCMESKKDKKEKKGDKCDKFDGYDYYEESENVEEIISKLSMKLETYDGSVDMEVYHHIYKDVIIYGFIKDKNDYNCKWKKFKIEKKCKGKKDPSYNYIQNYKRIEENFELDKLNEMDDSDRKDIIDFDKYESGIKKIKPTSTKGMGGTTMGTGAGHMMPPPAPMTPPPAPMMPPPAPMTPPPAPMMPPPAPMTPPPTPKPPITETHWKPWSEYEGNKTEYVKPSVPNCFGQLDLSDGEPENLNKKQPSVSNKVNIKGSIGKYFEKIAEGFAPFWGKLIDINYCNWYKIDVNSIEDLSDESNYNQYTLAYYPMLNYYPYISKAGHFLLGYKCNKDGDMQYIIYAIPGSKAKNDQPYGGRTGFVTWTNDDKSGKGYWLMFYDFKNSSIVIPTK